MGGVRFDSDLRGKKTAGEAPPANSAFILSVGGQTRRGSNRSKERILHQYDS